MYYVQINNLPINGCIDMANLQKSEMHVPPPQKKAKNPNVFSIQLMEQD